MQTTSTLETHSAVTITEFDPQWIKPLMSTHELAITKDFIFVSGQNMDQIAKFDYSGNVIAHFNMPANSGPHGLMIDRQQQLWVSLEFIGEVVRLDAAGCIVEKIDVKMNVEGTHGAINPAPHGICLGADGETIWFTGKRTSTLGKICPARKVEHFELHNLAAMPIFLQAGPDGHIWGTELLAGAIVNVAPNGQLIETPIPTTNSRPIGIIPDPQGKYMWFTEETGRKIGRIDTTQKNAEGQYDILEFTLPLLQDNNILGSLCFDGDMNLWVQVYVSGTNATGDDYILKLDKSIRQLQQDDLSNVPTTIYIVPSKKTMLHRIKMDQQGNLWFTEMMTDKLGKISL